jgi:hypothetical protein
MSTPETPRLLIQLVDAVDKALKPDAIRTELRALFGDDTDHITTWMNEMLTAAILDSVVKSVTPLLAPVPSSEDTPAPRVWRSAAAVPRYLDTSILLRADDGTSYSRPFASSEFWFRTLPDGTSGGRHRLADLPADAWPLSEVPAGGKA